MRRCLSCSIELTGHKVRIRCIPCALEEKKRQSREKSARLRELTKQRRENKQKFSCSACGVDLSSGSLCMECANRIDPRFQNFYGLVRNDMNWKIRKCLMCGEGFMSRSTGHRVCNRHRERARC